jgi:allophanate hydrolase
VSATTLLAVAGAHLRGEPLNGVLVALGASFVRETRTAPVYRMVALPPVPGRAGAPRRPGLIRCPADGDPHPGGERGASVEVELFRMPVRSLGSLLVEIAPPLAIGTLWLIDGTRVLGFVCEGCAAADSVDISGHGGWRSYLASLTPRTV